MPIFVPDLFSSYVEGRRKAIRDNWDDLNQYNQVLDGQLQNAMSMETFDDAARMEHNRAALSDMGRVQGAVDTQLGLQKYLLGQQANLPQMEIDARIAQLQQMILNLQQLKEQQQATQNTPLAQNVGTQTPKSTTNPTSTSATTALETTGVAASPNNPLGTRTTR